MSEVGHNIDLPEKRRLLGLEYAKQKSQSDFLMDMRKPSFEKIKQDLIADGEHNKSDAERFARMSKEYRIVLEGIRAAKQLALETWAEMNYLDLRFKEWQGKNATHRAEMGMNR